MKFIKEWGIFFLAIAAILVLRFLVATPVSVKGHSMDPTLADGQKLIVSKISKYQRFDVITTVEPDDQEKIAVKRVIGLPGDHIVMENDQLTINGQKYDEPYLDAFKKELKTDKLAKAYAYDSYYQQIAAEAPTFTQDFEVTVPENHYYVLGDNRLISKDSRIFGPVDQELMHGKVVLRYWPFADFSKL